MFDSLGTVSCIGIASFGSTGSTDVDSKRPFDESNVVGAYHPLDPSAPYGNLMALTNITRSFSFSVLASVTSSNISLSVTI